MGANVAGRVEIAVFRLVGERPQIADEIPAFQRVPIKEIVFS
jgi:hypothetical protein